MNCALCGGSEGREFLVSGGRRLLKCSGCGLVYTADFKAAGAAYAEDYFSGKNKYIERWAEFAAIFRPLVGKIAAFKPGGRLLDVGSSVGVLLTVARERGFSVKGVELSEWASEFSRREKKLDVVTGTLAGAALEAESFDVVVVNHVLEHVPDPRGLLAEARRVLKKDGLLAVGTPNLGSVMAALRGGKWRSLRPEQHIWHFTPETLGALLTEAGFEVFFFEAKDNYPDKTWGPRALLRRLISLASVALNRSEAMLMFARKRDKA